MGEKQSKAKPFLAGCFSGCLIVTVILFLLPVVLVVAACWNMESGVSSVLKKDFSNLTKTVPNIGFTWRWGDGDESDPKIARLYLRGIIKAEEERSGFGFLIEETESREHRLISKIKAVTANKEFDGIWLEIDSPGGEVTLSDEIYHLLCRFKESDKGRFVFVYFKSQACSGGYYVALAADRIMAGPVAWTGSIGVIVSGLNLSKLADKLGVEGVNIASSDNKAILNPLEPVNSNHVAIVQRVVDQNYNRFLNLVSKHRGIPVEKLRPLADGRIFSAQDAKLHDLIDAIGYEEEAFEEVFELAKKRSPEAKGMRVYTVETGDVFFKMPFPVNRAESLLYFLQSDLIPESVDRTSMQVK